MTYRAPPLWDEEELRAFCRETLRAFPRHRHNRSHARRGTSAGQKPAGGCA